MESSDGHPLTKSTAKKDENEEMPIEPSISLLEPF
jgi:hypothetical protein